MPIAFSIDFPRIVAVEVAGSAKKPRVKRVVVGALAEARNEDGTPVADKQGHLNAQVAAFVKENKLSGGKKYLLVGPDAMRYRELRLAFSDKRQINRVLQFQVEGLIPNIPIEDLTLGYNELVEEKTSTLLLIHAADRPYVRTRLTALEEADCSIEAVDSHLSGTINLGLLHPELAGDKPPTLWLDFAGTTAAVMVVDKDNVQTARVFVSPYLAGASGQTAHAASAKDAADAARLEAEARAREIAARHSEGLPSADSATLPASESANMGAEQVADRIRHMSRDDLEKFIKHVAIEARRTLAISRFEAEPQRLVISGLGHEGRDIAALLAPELSLAQQTAINLMEVVQPQNKEGKSDVKVPDLGEMTYLTGIALKGLGRDVTGINFRTGNLAAGTMMDYARTPLAFTATLALLLGGILLLVSFTHMNRYKADIAGLRDSGLRELFDKAYKDVDKTKKPSKQVLNQRTYFEDPENPGNEIETNYNKLAEHQKVLQGAVTDNFERPAPADQVLAHVLKALADGKPSYDFCLMRVDIANNNLNIVYLASVNEPAEERKKNDGLAETDRMFEALRKMTRANAKLFAADPKPGSSQRGQLGPDGREADQVSVQIPLVKTERRKPGAAKPTATKGGP